MKQQNRKPNRLKNYDYSQNGAYFITMCSKGKNNIFSKIVTNDSIICPYKVEFTEIGVAVEKGIVDIEEHYENVFVDNYVIMPNHIHLIIHIESNLRRSMIAPTIPRIIQQFKGVVTKQFNEPIWQKSYYDHIIRNEEDYFAKWQYIDDNPAKWLEDDLYRK